LTKLCWTIWNTFGETEKQPILTYEDRVSESDGRVDGPPPTLEELADFCDQGAESANHHDMIGVHRLLAVILFRQCGRAKATEIMTEIAERGGLDDMDMAGAEVPEPWHPWGLPAEREAEKGA
jgi:hypothetical protein